MTKAKMRFDDDDDFLDDLTVPAKKPAPTAAATTSTANGNMSNQSQANGNANKAETFGYNSNPMQQKPSTRNGGSGFKHKNPLLGKKSMFGGDDDVPR